MLVFVAAVVSIIVVTGLLAFPLYRLGLYQPDRVNPKTKSPTLGWTCVEWSRFLLSAILIVGGVVLILYSIGYVTIEIAGWSP